MFYSHQLLARKAPLGQIWMAATLHAKINRRSLHKLNIIKICEEILNPSVPMALRLSGILMGGVVIVYERKVKLLYDDVSRLLVEINEAWRVKAAPRDRTLLPKGRTHAKFEAVTMPDVAAEIEIDHPTRYKLDGLDTTAMKLDELDDAYIHLDPPNADLPENHHQADPANITLFGDFGSCMAETDLYNRFERFDIEDDDDPLFKFTHEASSIPNPSSSRHDIASGPSPSRHDIAPGPSPSRHDIAQGTGEIHMEEQAEKITTVAEQEKDMTPQHANEVQVNDQSASRQRPVKRKARARPNHAILDEEHLIIPGVIYQDWLGDFSDLVKKRGSTLKQLHPMGFRKVTKLMDLPPVALLDGKDVYYPAPLMELWRKCTQEQIANNSSTGGRSSDQAQDPLSHSPPRGLFPEDLPEYTMEDFQREIGPMQLSIEKLRENLEKMEFHGSESSQVRGDFESPKSPTARTAASNPSSGSGNSFLPLDPEVPQPSGRTKRRQQSSSAKSLGNLDPVQEEISLQQNARDTKLRRLSEKEPSPDFELLEETGPTQTPYLAKEPTIDKITKSIHSHLKIHFDTPGAPNSESLEQLASGMNRKRAAQLFYQTCVLATLDVIKVEQAVAYGDITIFRGPKM